VYFYLNKDNTRIRAEEKLFKDIREEGKQLLAIMQKKKFWDELPLILARFDTVCNLRRWKLMLTLVRPKDNILALHTQLWYQQNIQDRFMLDLQVAINQLPSEIEKKEFTNRLMKVLDGEIKEGRKALQEASEDLAVDEKKE
jgi:hypothetical protein